MAWGTLDFGGFPTTRGRQGRIPGERGRRRDESLFHKRAPAAWKHVDLVLLASAGAVSVLGALIGSVWLAMKGRDRATPIPFGPYLALAGWIVFMWGEQLLGMYRGYAGI